MFSDRSLPTFRKTLCFCFRFEILLGCLGFQLVLESASGDITIKNYGISKLDNLQNVLIIDDLLATGGTALAAIELIEKFENKKIVGAGFIIKYFHRESQFENEKNGVLLNGLIGYRYQNIKNRGFLVRLTLSPIYQPIDEGFKVYTGVSIGYLF